MVICKYFLQGECKFGENCKFDHQFPSGNISASGNQQPLQSHRNQNQVFTTKPANEVDTNTLISSVHNDMVSVEKSGQWLLTCYAPFKEKQLFPGFQDQSFEEIRVGFYEAQKTNTFEEYKQQLQQALLNARTKFKALQTPTKEMVDILRNIYNAQITPPSNSSSNQTSPFGNKATYGPQANSIFGQNAPVQIGNQGSGGSLFGSNTGQNSATQLFGQQNSNQNTAGIFGQPNKSNLFGQQSAVNNGTFSQNTNQQSANTIFANANKTFFASTNPTQNAKDIFGSPPQQANSFQQTNQSFFSGVGQTQQNQPQNIFAVSNQNPQFGTTLLGQIAPSQGAMFGQVNQVQNQPAQLKPDIIQGSANSPFLSQQSNPIFTNQNAHASNVTFGQNTNTIFNAQPQSGSLFNRLGQQEPSKTIFGSSNQNIVGNSPLAGNIYAGGNNAGTINHDAYSKLEELSEDDIKWFKSNDLDIASIPDKPPTYEMCFS